MTPSNLTVIISAFTFLVCCSQSPSEDKPDSFPLTESISNVALLAATCSGCHSADSVVGDLNNLTEQHIYNALTSYNEDDGTTVMHRLMKGYQTQDIQLISEYLGQTASIDNE